MRRGRPSNHIRIFSMQYTNTDGTVEVYKYNNKKFDLFSIMIPENSNKNEDKVDHIKNETQNKPFSQFMNEDTNQNNYIQKNVEIANGDGVFNQNKSLKDGIFDDIDPNIIELENENSVIIEEKDQLLAMDISESDIFYRPILYADRDNTIDFDDLSKFEFL